MENIDLRKKLSQQPIEWTGDLNKSCTASWAGLTMKVEAIAEDNWWWVVLDTLNNNLEVDSANNYELDVPKGVIARKLAERSAKEYLEMMIQ